MNYVQNKPPFLINHWHQWQYVKKHSSIDHRQQKFNNYLRLHISIETFHPLSSSKQKPECRARSGSVSCSMGENSLTSVSSGQSPVKCIGAVRRCAMWVDTERSAFRHLSSRTALMIGGDSSRFDQRRVSPLGGHKQRAAPYCVALKRDLTLMRLDRFTLSLLFRCNGYKTLAPTNVNAASAAAVP